MTRETKIGLLVGLAFIIVIGILLSDHMTSTNDPPKAPLSVAGANLRESVVTPAGPSANAPAAAAVGTAAGQSTAQTPVVPTQTVLTEAELAARQRAAAAAAQVIQVGPGVAAQQPPVVVSQGPVAPQLQSRVQIPAPAQNPAQNPVQVSPAGVATAPPAGDSPVVIAPPPAPPGVNQKLQQLASRHGEEIVPVGTAPAGGANTPRPQGVPMAPVREYKAQAGDSLSKMAARFLGSSNKASREAIVRMNPSLQQNPDKIIEGRTYILPPAPPADATAGATPAPATPTPTPAAPTPAAPEAATAKASEPAAPAAGTFTWYTVKENENLWKIAAEQLGSGNAWTQIRDLNQDILKGDDRLKINTKLRLPNKPVASAAH